MFGHPLARVMEKWWREHAGRPDDPQWHEYTEKLQKFLAIKFEEWTSEHENKIDGVDVYGMAKSGGCLRASNLKLMGFKGDEFSGSTQFTFALGHIVEAMGLATLEMCGYPIEVTQNHIELAGIMASASDGTISLTGKPTVLSCKSNAYKMSGRRFSKGKETWTRRGFPQLPFDGVKNTNPDHYMQIQNEMAGEGYDQGMMLYISKDIMKVFEEDEYLGDKGNGSLTFYCELIQFEPEIAEMSIEVHQEQWENYQQGKAGVPYVITPKLQYAVLPKPGKVESNNMWGGPNQEAQGRFNPCGGCQLIEACNEVE